jgi:hypothetical protein
MLWSSRRMQPPVECLWSLVPSFPGSKCNTLIIFLFLYVILYCYSLMSTICMKLDSGMHIGLHLVFFREIGVTPDLRGNEIIRKVEYEKTPDGKETFKVTVSASRHGGQGSSTPVD